LILFGIISREWSSVAGQPWIENKLNVITKQISPLTQFSWENVLNRKFWRDLVLEWELGKRSVVL
jgi:hypothetical protein